MGSRTRFLRAQGQDFEEIANELAEEKKLLESLGLNAAPTSQPQPTFEVANDAQPAQ